MPRTVGQSRRIEPNGERQRDCGTVFLWGAFTTQAEGIGKPIMSRSALKRIWSFFAATLLTLSFLLFLRTTGVNVAGDSFGLLGYKATHLPVLALPVDLVLLVIVLWLTYTWSVEVGGQTWAERFPVFYFDRQDVDPQTRGGRLYQGWAFVLVLVMPFVLTLHMYVKFMSGKIYRNGDPPQATGLNGWSFMSAWQPHGEHWGTFLRFGGSDGPQFYVIQPWLYTLAVIAVAAWWVWVVVTVVRSTASDH